MPNYQPSPVVPAQAQAELITQGLYDSASIATAATSAVFFGGANTNNLLLSNVPQASQLSHPKFFRVGGFRLIPDANVLTTANLTPYASIVEDYVRMFYGGYYTFTIGALKNYLTVPMFMLPAGVGFQSANPTGSNVGYTFSNGNPIFSAFYRLKHWISIPPLQAFGGNLTWPTALTLNNTCRVWNWLDGEFGREVL